MNKAGHLCGTTTLQYEQTLFLLICKLTSTSKCLTTDKVHARLILMSMLMARAVNLIQ